MFCLSDKKITNDDVLVLLLKICSFFCNLHANYSTLKQTIYDIPTQLHVKQSNYRNYRTVYVTPFFCQGTKMRDNRENRTTNNLIIRIIHFHSIDSTEVLTGGRKIVILFLHTNPVCPLPLKPAF